MMMMMMMMMMMQAEGCSVCAKQSQIRFVLGLHGGLSVDDFFADWCLEETGWREGVVWAREGRGGAREGGKRVQEKEARGCRRRRQEGETSTNHWNRA